MMSEIKNFPRREKNENKLHVVQLCTHLFKEAFLLQEATKKFEKVFREKKKVQNIWLSNLLRKRYKLMQNIAAKYTVLTKKIVCIKSQFF